MSIKAVIFDLDDTLVPEHSAWDGAFLEACEPAANEHGFDAVALRTAVFTIARQIWKASDVFECCNANGFRLHSGLLWLSWDFADYEEKASKRKA